jgi:hypothetical protein
MLTVATRPPGLDRRARYLRASSSFRACIAWFFRPTRNRRARCNATCAALTGLFGIYHTGMRCRRPWVLS